MQINFDRSKSLSFGKALTHQQQTSFENIEGKEEIARNEQFLLFPQCFLLNQKIVFPTVHISDIIPLLAAELEKPKIGISGKWLNNRSLRSGYLKI